MRFGRTSSLLTVLIGVALAASLPASAAGTAFRYDATQRVINACVLGVNGQTLADHPSPYIIEGMRRSDLAPEDWNFVNALAPPTVVEGDVAADFVVKGKPEYWFVSLTDETANQLVGMDLIFISAPDLDLTPRQQAGLQAAVEAGAVLWVDNAILRDANGDPTDWTRVTNFPWVLGFDFEPTPANRAWALKATDPGHMLLREPHPIDALSVTRLGDRPDRPEYDTWVPPDPALPIDPNSTLSEGFFIPTLGVQFREVIQNVQYDDTGVVQRAAAWAVAADYGSGSVLVTAGGVGRDVAEWLLDRGTGQWRPTPDFLQAPDVKFALNAIRWNDRWQQARGNPRASATTVARAPFPLDIAWQYPDRSEDPAAVSIGAVVSTPVQSRNLLYALSIPSTTGGPLTGSLMCFDLTPEEDRDGDGMADDGAETDYSRGAPYDMIWRVELLEGATSHYSSPTLTSYTDPGNDLSSLDDDVFYPQVALISYVDPATGGAWVDCYDASIANGGTLLWRRRITPYSETSATAEVVSLSTPIVHKGYVYVLASEYDPALAGANNQDSSYGRAHCFELDYPWDPTDSWPSDASWWVYPANQTNIDGIGTDLAIAEPQKALPAFHDPRWVSRDLAIYPSGRTPLPPAPGATPVVHAVGTTAAGEPVDALLTFGTAVSLRWASPDIRINNAVGGSQYTLVPTPLRVDDESPAKPGYGSAALPWGVGLNEGFYSLRLNNDITSYTPGATTLLLGGTLSEDTFDPANPRYLRFSPAAVREAAIQAAIANGDPLDAQVGIDVNVIYNLSAVPEAHRLAGPVLWHRALKVGQRIYQPSSMGTDEIAVTSGRPIEYRYITPPPNPPPGSGAIEKLDASSGVTRWTYDPIVSMPNVPVGAVTSSTTAAAFTDETLIVGTSAVEYPAAAGEPGYSASSIIGLARQMDLQVDFMRAADGTYPVAVYMLWPGAVVHHLAPGSYTVDPWSGRLTFPAASAAEVMDIDGVSVGAVYGRALRVQWPDGTLEDHVAPAIERFHLTPGYIRLRHYPYDPATVEISRPDGTLVDPATIAPVTPGTDLFGGRQAVLDGWIDMRAAVDADGVPIAPGDEILVSYHGWSEAGGGWIAVPNAAFNIAIERHQLAPIFGASVSSPAVGDDTIHIGTQGRDRNLNGDFDPDATAVGDPEPPPDPATLLSLIWNKATGYVRSATTVPARPQPGVGGIPVVSGPPSLAEDAVFVGSRMMGDPANQDIGPGYVSALRPWSVLLCDSSRIVETIGSEPSWVCTGTSSPQRTQSFIGEDLRRPFSRPAKATRLPNGDILVVDTGNHRVVEIDRAGRIVWPLDLYGYEYYTSSDNHDLKLSRPADANRYYGWMTIDVGGTPERFPVVHTVIADTGNARVIDIQTTFHDPVTLVRDGRQRHTITTVTPTYVQVGGSPRGYERVRYTSAAPINDPGNGALIGYLCAASNLNQLLVVSAGGRIVNPYASLQTSGGTAGATWAPWAWLYDADPADTNDVSGQPLQFENIKNVSLKRIGGTIYVGVTCSRYIGRSGEPAHALAAAGPGVFEFRIDVSSSDPADWQLDQMGTGAAWPTMDPHWFFVGDDYRGRPMTTISTAAGDFDNRWYPVSAQRVSSDTVLITNSLSQTENATPANIGGGARQAVIGSHIFEVLTDDGGDADPTNDLHALDPQRSVPAPGQAWADPFVQPAYAEVK